MESQIDNILYQFSYPTLYGLTVIYFLVLYFGVGSIFLFICKFLERNHLLNKIVPTKVSNKQIIFEIKHSIKSIIIFGFSIIPIIYLIRVGSIKLLPNTSLNLILGLVLLTLWNEIHFYIVHRIMHQRFFMKNVHYIHHQSTVPTVYSVFSFHWFEALLLSTVPIAIVPFIPFSILAVFIFPLVSILLNFAGHCNYRFGDGKGISISRFGTEHNDHHSKGKMNYGFAINLLDQIFSKKKNRR